jgi:hypothetical protein
MRERTNTSIVQDILATMGVFSSDVQSLSKSPSTWIDLVNQCHKERVVESNGPTVTKKEVGGMENHSPIAKNELGHKQTTLFIQSWWGGDRRITKPSQTWQSSLSKLMEARVQDAAAATKCQRWWRKIQERAQVRAAIKIQRSWRAIRSNNLVADYWQYITMMVRAKKADASRQLQRWSKSCLDNKRNARTQAKWSALVSMERSRRETAATKIQMFGLRYLELKWWRYVLAHNKCQHAAAVYIQKWWRGNDIAARCISEPLLEARDSSRYVESCESESSAGTINQVSLAQEAKTPLRYRLRRALKTLKASRQPQVLLRAAQTLEICTRLTNECRAECMSRGIPDVLYRAVRACYCEYPELLYPLLQVCYNLQALDDLDGMLDSTEMWINVMQKHCHSATLFPLAASLCEYGIQYLKEHHRDLGDIQLRLRLLHRSMAMKAGNREIAELCGEPQDTQGLHPRHAADMLQELMDCAAA